MTQTEKHALWAQEEQSAEMHGWDFSHIRGRVVEAPLPWDYKQKVLDFLKPQSVILDMGPGGGEDGGTILFEGTPEELIEIPASKTARYLGN